MMLSRRLYFGTVVSSAVRGVARRNFLADAFPEPHENMDGPVAVGAVSVDQQ
jgi:hypothetical protein